MKVAGAVIAAVALVGVGLAAARPAVTALPPTPVLTSPVYLSALAAAGSHAAIATGCIVRVLSFPGPKVFRLKAAGDCRTDPYDSAVVSLALGRTALVATEILSPSPHGDTYSLWSGPLPSGPLHQVGGEWGWTDSDVPMGYGCAWSVAAGGGVVALAKIPNRLAVDQGLESKPACPAGAAARIMLLGAPRAQVTVPGSWMVLATDGKRLALSRLDAAARPTGELLLVDLSGKRLAAPAVDPAVVRAAFGGWLTPQGLVLQTAKAIVGQHWTVATAHAREATLAEGRLFYVVRRTIRIRRLSDQADKPLVSLPADQPLLAAGSFGLAVAIGTDSASKLYRLPWSTIDRTLPAR